MRPSIVRDNESGDPRGRLRLPVRPDAVVAARRAVGSAATAAGLPPDRVDDLLVALSEAVTNALEAQLHAGVTAPIHVDCRVAHRLFEVIVRDRGEGFVPDALPARPPVTDPRHLDLERGWGIQLMRALVDEVVFDVTGPGTAVRLRMSVR